MYQVENSEALVRLHRSLFARRPGRTRVARTVLLLGVVSLLTDVSAEMVATVLPLYLVYTLGLSPLQFGIVDGLYQGAAALVRVVGGFLGDRSRRHKEVAAVGYGLSALCKGALLLAGSAVTALGAIVAIDRVGKGIRTAPRDALISLSSRREDLGTAFGVHRAMDTAGAMIGPLVAFGLLLLAPQNFDPVFFVSFCIALLGLGVLLFFVENPAPGAPTIEHEPVSLRAAAGLLRKPRFGALVLVGAALSVATISDGFLYLGLQRRLDFELSFFPLLFVGTAFVYMLLAAPFGRLADRIGRGKVFIGGYVLLLGVYGSFLIPPQGIAELAVYLALFGAYYAATDGVLMALASEILPAGLRGSGLALLVTATSICRLVASALFGALWTAFGLQAAVVSFAVGLAAAACLATAALARPQSRQADV
jgi:MFS family permease